MAGLKLSFLGSPQIERDNVLLQVSASKALALLAYLAVTGKNHSRDALSSLLWPENDQSRARTYLRHALWSLKKEVGERWLQISREQIGFEVDEDVWLDVAVLQAAIAAVAGHDHAAGQMCFDCLEQLQEAVSLYRDGFLAGFTLADSPAFDEWQFFQAEELRQMLASALERLVQEYITRQAHESALRYARRWLALDPLHEPVHRVLMRLYALVGQQAAALRQYQECVRLLEDELGVEPDEETRVLYERIRTRQFGPAGTADATEANAHLLPPARYLIDSLLETGAHGEVYRGHDVQTGEPVIIKRLRSDAVEKDRSLLARFMQEAEALGQLNHPNIVGMLATFERDGRQHLVMEYVTEGSLAQRLQQQPQMPLIEAVDIALELADALSRAHHLNIIHRDVKPENVLLAADGTPRLADFGVARLAKKEGRLTNAGVLLGSPAYMSPECLQGAEPDERSDVWSFGVLLFEMLAGQRPFAGEQIIAVLVSILNDPTPDIRHIRPDVPVALADLLQRMLVKEPAARIVSMRQVAAELEAIRAGRQRTHLVVGTNIPANRMAPETDASAPSSAISASISPFVAREPELARLDDMLRKTLNGQLHVAFILGEAGQGKTALLQAFARRAQESYPSLVTTGGNCNAYTGLGDPYLPFREILAVLTADLEAWSLFGALHPESAQRIKRLLPETVRALVNTAPDLIDTFVPLTGLLERTAVSPLLEAPWRRQLLNLAKINKPAGDVNIQQNALLEQYSRLLQLVAHRAPLLIILDDLQWTDLGSVALLFHLGRRLSNCQIFIVGAYRPAEVAMGRDSEPHPLARVVDELQRVFGDILIDLGEAEGQAFIDAWLDSEPNRLGPFFRRTLYRQTGGHPLFTIELLHAMRERGDLTLADDGVYEVSTSINWNTMPARVEGAIGERIKRLDPALQELLQTASVEGDEFTAEAVAKALRLDERETVRRLSRELDRVHALVQAIGIRRGDERRLSRYRFRHILIQRYLYNSLDDVEQVYQHEAIGSALEKLYGKGVTQVAVQLARHFEMAQLPGKAAGYSYLAGDQARRTAALGEAILFYQAALLNWPEDDKLGRAVIMRKLGECHWMIGHADDALETFETGHNLFQELGDVKEAGATLRLIGRVYWELGDREKSLLHDRQALSILEQLPDSVELAWAISSISQMHMLAVEYDQAVEWGERALVLARRLQAEAVIVHALNNVGSCYIDMGQRERGQAMLEESIRRAMDENLPHDACRGRLNLGEGLASLDLYEDARTTFEELYDYAGHVYTTLYAASSLIELARLDWLNGHWRTALSRRPLIQEWLERGQSMAYPQVIASTLMGQQYNDLGQPVAAYGVLQSRLSEVRGFDELQLTNFHLAQMGRSLATLGEDKETREVTHELLSSFAHSHYNSRFTAQPVLIVSDILGTHDAADLIDEIVATLKALAQDSANIQVPSRNAALHEAQGSVALFQENHAQAVDLFHQSVTIWKTIQRPYDQARALNKLGRALVLTNACEHAYDAFTQANALLEELAAQLDEDETKAAFLQSLLVQSIQENLLKLRI